MSNKVELFLDSNLTLHMRGNVSFYNCTIVKKQYLKYKNIMDKVTINLKHLNNEDSSIILLIINIIRLSKNKKVKFINISESLRRLITSYKLKHIIY